MGKNQMKYYIDVCLGTTFALCFFTGLMKWPTKIIGSTRQQMVPTILYDYSGLFLCVFVFIHLILILNLNWMVSMTKKIRQKNK